MNSKVYKWCVVPQCNSTSIKTPSKLFVYVPNKKTMRNKWLTLARRDPTALSLNTSVYFCEDHFDLPNDMENFMEYHVMGSVSQVRMKPGCIPTKFECQIDRMEQTANTTQQPIVKKQRQAEEFEKDLEERSIEERHLELREASSSSSDLSDEEKQPEQSQDAPVRLAGSGTSRETREEQIVENIEPIRRDEKSGHSSSTDTALSDHDEPASHEKKRTKITRLKKEYFNLTKEETDKFLYMKERPKKDTPVCKEQIEYAMIASVYHYLQKEYEYMKSYVSESCDLSPLANVVQRTADATGTCIQIVTAILKAERFQKNINSAVPANKTVVWLDHDYHIHDLRKRQRISRPKRGQAAYPNVDGNVDESSCDSLDHLYTDQLPVVPPTKPETATSSSGVVVDDYNSNSMDYLQSNHKEEEAADYDENLIMKCEVFEHSLSPQNEQPHDEVEPAASDAKRRKVKIEPEYDEYQQSSSADHALCLPHTTRVKIETSSDESIEMSERDPLKFDSTTNSLLAPAPKTSKAQAERQRQHQLRPNQEALNNPERRKKTPKIKTESQRQYKLKKRTKKAQNNGDEPPKNCYQREYKTRKKDRESNASARAMQEGPSSLSYC